MPDYSIDVIKIAKAIQKDELSILRGKEFKIRDKIRKNKGRGKHVKKSEDRLTLAELAKKIDNLGNNLRNEMNAGFRQVNSRIDNLEKDINTRLDYIVKANNLKDIR